MKCSTGTSKMLEESKEETAKRDKLTESCHVICKARNYCDLGLLYNALSELANLSQQLQAHLITLLRADQLLKRWHHSKTSQERNQWRN